MKHFLLTLLLLVGLTTSAEAQLGSVTYVFSPTTTARSAEVNVNFSVIHTSALKRNGGGSVTGATTVDGSGALTFNTGTTLTFASGSTATFANGTTLNFNSAATVGAVWTFSSAPVIGTITNTGTLTLPTSTDTLVGRATTDTLTNKTLTAPVLGGSVTGTYTLAGTPTITSPTISTPAISAPVLSGSVTGTYTIAGTPTLPKVTSTNYPATTSAELAGVLSNESGTGLVVYDTDTALVRPELTNTRETKATGTISTNTLAVSLASGNHFAVALNAAITTFTISTVPASGKAAAVVFTFTADGSVRAITWPSGTVWAGGIAPTMTGTNGKRDIVTLYTWDGGTVWFGVVNGQNF